MRVDLADDDIGAGGVFDGFHAAAGEGLDLEVAELDSAGPQGDVGLGVHADAEEAGARVADGIEEDLGAGLVAEVERRGEGDRLLQGERAVFRPDPCEDFVAHGANVDIVPQAGGGVVVGEDRRRRGGGVDIN